MKLDIQKLKQAAQKATQGQWIVESQDCRWNVTDAEGVQIALAQKRTATRDDPKQADRTANAEFIALANPENVQVLISQRDDLLAALEDVIAMARSLGDVQSEYIEEAVSEFIEGDIEDLITSIKGGAE
ncbi:hypothetical protein [Klebsiella phage vB_KpnP_ZX1]|nr:hypothetical protein [Klebsiella phage vB_KpnP_ZX1]